MLKFSGSSYLIWDLIGCVCVLDPLKREEDQEQIADQGDSTQTFHYNSIVTRTIYRSEVRRVSSQSSAFDRSSSHCKNKINTGRVQQTRTDKCVLLSGVCRHSNKHTLRRTWECNVRSKIWWFTKICNSHYVSHFAAFFIVVRAKTSVAESCKAFTYNVKGSSVSLWDNKSDDRTFFFFRFILFIVICLYCGWGPATRVARPKSGTKLHIFTVIWSWKILSWGDTRQKPYQESQLTRATIPMSSYLKPQTIRYFEWSFRRFTYGNLVTTSPSSKWWGLNNFPQPGCPKASKPQSEIFTEPFNR